MIMVCKVKKPGVKNRLSKLPAVNTRFLIVTFYPAGNSLQVIKSVYKAFKQGKLGFVKGNLYILSSGVIKYKTEKNNLLFFPGFRKKDIVFTPVMRAHISGGCLHAKYRLLCIFSSYGSNVIPKDGPASLVTLLTDKLKYALVCYRRVTVLPEQL